MSIDPGPTWVGLTVLVSEGGLPDEDHGTVEFVASFRGPRGPGRMHEVSAFERRAGRWFYVDGVVT